jgi:hypothetical protein
MSEQTQRTVQFSEIADMLPKGGDYHVEDRYGSDPDAEFVPWGRSNFKPAPDKQPPAPAKEPETEQHEKSADEDEQTSVASEGEPGELNEPAPTPSAKTPAAAPAGARPSAPPPKPPPPPEPPGPTAEEIIAAINQAREDGRALGYQQGVEATKRELSATLSTLRKIETQITTLAADALERNADIMAHHVRRIAQDLFGAVFAEMPEVFVERIKTAAEMFTKAGADFTLALNPHDALTLNALMQENEIFEKIRIVEDDSLHTGVFHLSSRDLDYEDAPLLSDVRGS